MSSMSSVCLPELVKALNSIVDRNVSLHYRVKSLEIKEELVTGNGGLVEYDPPITLFRATLTFERIT